MLAFVAGVAVAGGSDERDSVQRFGAAWAAGDYDAMYAELNPESQSKYSSEDFAAAYTDAATTSTSTSVAVDDARGPIDQSGTDVVALPTTIQTNAFGPVSGEIAVPVADDGVSWQPNIVFPGLGEGDELVRKTVVPKRAPILAADRKPLASGPAIARTTTAGGGVITGETGKPPAERRAQMTAEGFPEGGVGGKTGLELAFDSILAGTPGGKLYSSGDDGKTLIAEQAPVPGKPVRTTIDADLQDATVAALGSTFGGAAVLDAENGNVLALAGQAFSALQPPGSTFKVITATAALENGETKLSEEFPVETGAVVDGREISNAYNEPCGGSLIESFAHSCNSVFAPLGVRVGGDAMVKTAELYGFNSPPTLYNAEALALTQPPMSSIPTTFESDLDLAVSSIGQGQVQATPLAMASASQAIAARRRPLADRNRQGPRACRRLPDGEGHVARDGRRDEADDDRRRQLGHRRLRLASRRPGGRQDRHRRARHQLRSPARGGRGPRARRRRLVHRLRAGRQGEARGGGRGLQRPRRRRHGRRPDRGSDPFGGVVGSVAGAACRGRNCSEGGISAEIEVSSKPLPTPPAA